MYKAVFGYLHLHINPTFHIFVQDFITCACMSTSLCVWVWVVEGGASDSVRWVGYSKGQPDRYELWIIFHQRAFAHMHAHTHTHSEKLIAVKGKGQVQCNTHTDTYTKICTDTSDHTSDLWLGAAGSGHLWNENEMKTTEGKSRHLSY